MHFNERSGLEQRRPMNGVPRLAEHEDFSAAHARRHGDSAEDDFTFVPGISHGGGLTERDWVGKEFERDSLQITRLAWAMANCRNQFSMFNAK